MKNNYLIGVNDLIGVDGKILLNESERTRAEIWTRIMGYHRPISEFNLGKRGEYDERVNFVLNDNEMRRLIAAKWHKY